MSQAIFFKIYKDNKLQGIKQVRQDQASIGQSSEVEICLDGKNVLPWHALVEKRGDEYVISDLGSSSGTFVNEKKIIESPLKTGDRIQIDNFLIEFFIDVPYVKSVQKPSSVEPVVQDVKEPQVLEEAKKQVEKTAKKTKEEKNSKEESCCFQKRRSCGEKENSCC